MPVRAPGQIHKWTCHKLESFSEFIDSYSRATRKAAYCYLELFTGSSVNPCNGVDCYLEGTALRVLKGRTKFSRCGFLTNNRPAEENLKQLTASINNHGYVEVLAGNPNNEKSLRSLLDVVPRSSSTLTLVDPGGYRRLNWATLEKMVAHGKNWQNEKMDLLIVFPLEMALLRNLMRPECEASITRFYGNQQWEEIKRQKLAQKIKPQEVKHRLVEIYKNSLVNLGYRYVEDYKPASPTQNPYYHLIYASDRSSRLRYMKEAWGKVRFLRCELLYNIKASSK